jgi:WD40 repeat protein
MSRRITFTIVLIVILIVGSVSLIGFLRTNALPAENRPPITIQNAATVAQLGSLDVGDLTVASIAFSPDGKHLLSTHPKGEIREWDLATGQSTSLKSPAGVWVSKAIYSPDGAQIASPDAGDVILWDANSKTQIFVLKGETKSWVRQLAYSPDGKILASGGDEKVIRLWDVKTGKELNTLTVASRVSGLAFSPDGATLAAIDGNTAGINFWEVSSGKTLPGISTAKRYYHSIAFSKDGTLLAAGGSDKVVSIFDVAKQSIKYNMEGHGSRINEIAFDANNSLLVSGSADGTVRLWDSNTGSGFSPIKKDLILVNSVALNRDGTLIAIGGADGLIHFWGIPDGGALPFPAPEPFTPKAGHWTGNNGSISVRFDLSADGKITNFYWKWTLGNSYCAYEQKAAAAVENNAFSFSPDGQKIGGKFRSATSFFGTSPDSMRCGSMVAFSSGGPATWWVNWKED